MTSLSAKITQYKAFSKSGIVTLVLISVVGGYFMSMPLDQSFQIGHFVLTLAGVLFLASGSSALNQFQEIRLDAKMPRTAGRPLPSGGMSEREALIFIGVSLLIGILCLAKISVLVLFLGLGAVFSYNGLYTMWWKPRMAYAAVPGAVPGALPILMGAASAADGINASGVYWFFILFFWQMPHFWVLADRYSADYRAGGIPTLPVSRGTEVTHFQIVLWCLAYIGLALAGPLFLEAEWIYFIGALVVSVAILFELVRYSKARLIVSSAVTTIGTTAEPDPTEKKAWLRFFLWVNFSLILFLLFAVIDRWKMVWFPSLWVE
ncbi:MAG: protoheme IX farnesyltransferase [Xanthomonadaceae bacterium]|nr:protoheme IX farnesyltransferase [Xanthomonadaceae bacterium]